MLEGNALYVAVAEVSFLFCLGLGLFMMTDFFSTGEGNLVLIILILTFSVATSLILIVSTMAHNRRLRQELREATEKRGQVEELGLAAAGLAHETKNPLGIIRGLAQQIADSDSMPPEAVKRASRILEAADVTTVRLGDFMRYAKLQKPEPVIVKAADHIETACGLMTDDFQNSKIQRNIDVDPVTIRVDPEMFSQVLLNLLSNSLNSMEGGDTVTVALKRAGRNHARLTVADSGAGIPADFLPNIFKPYASKRKGGYGIGLAIVNRIVQESGWDIHVKSKEGEGTEVTIEGIECVQP